jgi:glycosyltransferase involved in cell wall biosynthesis
VERKNILFLIEAISKLKEKAELVVVGEGPLRKELKEKAKNMGASVSFLGRVTEEEKYTALKKADLFTMASWHEGFGIVFLEAMAAGLPIISTNRGGQTYFLKKDRNACFFSPSNLDSFLSAFDFFYKNREKLKEFGSNNQEAVRRFYIANIAKRYLELMV